MPNLATRFYNFMNPHALILPTPDTQAPQSGESNADALPPIKNWSHPFKDQRNPFAQLTHLANAGGGGYPLGGNGLWHGGVCEKVDVTPWVSPWSWEGSETLFNYDSPRGMHVCD